MRIIVEMEIESEDYGGKEFKKEIEKLLKDIDPQGRLTKIKMSAKFVAFTQDDAKKKLNWKENNYTPHD